MTSQLPLFDNRVSLQFIEFLFCLQEEGIIHGSWGSHLAMHCHVFQHLPDAQTASINMDETGHLDSHWYVSLMPTVY